MQVECVLKKQSHYNWPSLEGDGQPKKSSSLSAASTAAAAAAAAAAPIATAGNVKSVTHEQHSAASSSSSTAMLPPAVAAAAAPTQGLAKPYSSNRNWNAIDREITKELEVSHFYYTTYTL
jgi:hypothetical protein